MADVHPGSWLGDSVEEFKRAPTGVKIAIGVAFIAAAGIGYYEYSKSSSSTSGVSGQASPSTDLTGSGGTGVQSFATVPGGNTGTVPIIPSGYTALFDAAGNLIGFQQPGTTGTSTTPTGGTTPPTKTKPPKTGGGGKKGGGGTNTKGTGHGTHKTPSGTHTVKSKSGNTKQPVISGNVQHTKAPSRSIQPKNTGGSHGYVYTTKPGDTTSLLQARFFPTSNNSNKQGNILQYGNNQKILSQKGITDKNGNIKPGTKILA